MEKAICFDKTGHRVRVFDFLVYTICFSIVLLDYLCLFEQSQSKLVWFSFFFVFAVSVAILFLDDAFISVNKMIAVYSFLFLYFAPIHQYVEGKTYYSMGSVSENTYLYANFIIVFFSLCYLVFYKIFHTKANGFFRVKDVRIGDVTCIVILLIDILSILYLYKIGELFNFVEDSYNQNTLDSLSSIILKIVRFLPVATLMFSIYAKRGGNVLCKRLLFHFMFAVNAVICFIIYFPLNGSIGRFFLFGVYIALIVCFNWKLKNRSWLLIIFALGFYFVFPAFNFFKYNSILNISEFRLGGFDVSSNDYDSYYMLLKTIEYVKENGMVLGKNILAGVLWFVPRSVWTSKAVPSGQFVSGTFDAAFTNVSCPYCAELYLAFGMFGVLVGAVILAFFVAYLQKSKSYFWQGIFAIMTGLIISFMRGAFLPVMSAWMSMNLAYVAVYFVLSIVSRTRKCKG